MVALATEAPEGSLTVPCTPAVVSCANAPGRITSAISRTGSSSQVPVLGRFIFASLQSAEPIDANPLSSPVQNRGWIGPSRHAKFFLKLMKQSYHKTNIFSQQ